MGAALLGLLAPGLIGTTGGAFLVGAINIGISLGLNLLGQALFGDKGPEPQKIKAIFKQSAGPRLRHYGRVRVGGTLAFLEVENGNLHFVVMFGQGEFDAFEGFYINDGVFTLGPSATDPESDGWAQESPHNGKTIYIETRVGSPTQVAFAILVDRFPTIWSSAHRLDGVACAHVIQHAVKQEDFGEVYQSRQVAEINVLARACRVYDPRSGDTEWSTNAALILRDYLTHPDGAQVPADMIDDDLFEAAADVCDELVPVKGGGNLQRYQISLSYELNADPITVMARILTAMDGRLFLTPAGTIGVIAGKWIEPTVHVLDEHILDYDLEDGAGPLASANEVVVKYMHTGAGYTETTAQPWRDEDAISEQGQVLSSTITALEIQQHNHARRIAKINLHRSAPRWKGTIVTTLFGLEALDQRWIKVSLAERGIDEEYFEIVDSPNLDPETMEVHLPVQSFGPAAYEFDPETEEGDAPPVPEVLLGDVIAPPASITTGYAPKLISTFTTTDTVVTGVDLETGETTTEEVETEHNVWAYVLTASAPVPDRPDLRLELQYDDIAGDEDWQDIAVATGFFNAESKPVERGATYAIRGRYRATGNAVSAWTAGLNVTVPTDDPE